MGGGARRERGASQQPQARLGRAILVAFCMRKRSHESCRFRMVGACPDAAFRSAHPLHSCARDTDQLVELALFGIPDAAAQKKTGRQMIGSRCAAFSRRGTKRIMRCDHDYG